MNKNMDKSDLLNIGVVCLCKVFREIEQRFSSYLDGCLICSWCQNYVWDSLAWLRRSFPLFSSWELTGWTKYLALQYLPLALAYASEPHQALISGEAYEFALCFVPHQLYNFTVKLIFSKLKWKTKLALNAVLPQKVFASERTFSFNCSLHAFSIIFA